MLRLVWLGGSVVSASSPWLGRGLHCSHARVAPPLTFMETVAGRCAHREWNSRTSCCANHVCCRTQTPAPAPHDALGFSEIVIDLDVTACLRVCGDCLQQTSACQSASSHVPMYAIQNTSRLAHGIGSTFRVPSEHQEFLEDVFSKLPVAGSHSACPATGGARAEVH